MKKIIVLFIGLWCLSGHSYESSLQSTGEGGGDFIRSIFISEAPKVIEQLQSSEATFAMKGLEISEYKKYLSVKRLVSRDFKRSMHIQERISGKLYHDKKSYYLDSCYYDHKSDQIVLQDIVWKSMLERYGWYDPDPDPNPYRLFKNYLSQEIFYCLSLLNKKRQPSLDIDIFHNRFYYQFVNKDYKEKLVEAMRDLVKLVMAPQNRELFPGTSYQELINSIDSKRIVLTQENLFDKENSRLDAQLKSGVLYINASVWRDYTGSVWGSGRLIYSLSKSPHKVQMILHEIFRLAESKYKKEVYNDDDYRLSINSRKLDYKVIQSW